MTLRRVAALGLLAAAALSLSAVSAAADTTGRLVGVAPVDGKFQIIFQADGLPTGVSMDPQTVKVRIAGQDVTSTAEPITSGDAVSRIAMLSLDNSQSMAKDGKLASAKAAATTFLQTLPADVRVGLVTFANTAETKQAPTLDKAQVQAAIDAIEISPVSGTALYDGAALAADEASGAGSGSVLLLTDGREDGSSTGTLEDAVSVARDNDVTMDAVYIGPAADQPKPLTDIITRSGDGLVIPADTGNLDSLFAQAAEAIQGQLLILADAPQNLPEQGNVSVAVQAGDTALTASSFRSFSSDSAAPPPSNGPIPIDTASGSVIGKSALPMLLGALFIGLLVIIFVALSALRRDEKQGRVRRRLSIYTLTGRTPVKQEETTTALGSSQVARSAVELAGKVVQKRDFESGLTLRLEAAGVPLRAAEWMIIHIGVAIGVAILLLLLSGGKIFPTLLGLIIGLALPWAYLIRKESKRTTAFLAQLPDTLQLVAGSLSAGYSMPQAMDTVVREGQQPITGEFNRALVEARLGVPIEDAMDGVAERMKSKDFAWVVMAIRIQREVGGNLAELLTTVSATLRERERLRRQVQVLSAEGRLSAWILGLLPVVFALYLALVRPEYLKPLVSEPLGWLLLGFGFVLLVVGALWLRKAVKVEV